MDAGGVAVRWNGKWVLVFHVFFTLIVVRVKKKNFVCWLLGRDRGDRKAFVFKVFFALNFSFW